MNIDFENHQNFPSFKFSDFSLREKRDSDVEDFFRYYSDPLVSKFILCGIPTTIEEARIDLHYWKNVFYKNDGIYFAIAENQNDKMIGSIGLTSHNFYQRRIELSYDLDHRYWRKGIMLRAIKPVVEYAFNELNVNRIEASVSIDNIPSKNLLLKFGFTLEGILREHRFHKDKFHDIYFFSLLKKDLM